MYRRKMVVLLILATLIFAVSCKAKVEADETREVLVIEHELGRAEIEGIPQRVVVFDYGVLDILDYIGVDPIGLVKREFPQRLAKYQGEEYENIGTLFEPNFEKIFELQPDLILISGRQRNVYSDLAEIAPVIYFSVDGPTYFSDLEKNARLLGKIFDKDELVENKLKDIQSSLNTINKDASKYNALFLMVNGASLSVYGPQSRFDQIYSSFGFNPIDENIEIVNHGNRVSYEYLYEKNPDYLFVIDRGAVITDGEDSINSLLNNTVVRSLDAYKNNNIVLLDTFAWYLTAGGLGSTSLMVEEVESSLK